MDVKYEATVDHDPVIHAKGYSGKLSNVNLMGAEHLVKSKAGLLKQKPKDATETNTDQQEQ